MPLDDVTHTNLTTIFAGVLRSIDAEAKRRELRTTGEVYFQAGLGDEALLFTGDVLAAVNSISAHYSRSALQHGGFDEKAVRSIVIEATRVAAQSVDEALRLFSTRIDASPVEFAFAEPLGAYCGFKRLSVAKCVIYQDLSDALPSETSEALTELRETYPARVLVTQVSAQDERSAYVLAQENFDEARAILAILSAISPGLRPRETLQIDITSGKWASQVSSIETFYIDFVDAAGKLQPGYSQLSDAGQREKSARTDWERRTLSATRWYYRGLTTPWPTAELAAYFNALEALFTNQERKGKGEAIARRINRLRPTALDPDKRYLRRWLPKSYARRNSILHEAASHDDEIEVGRLRDLTRSTLAWAVWHLDPWHTGIGDRPCASFGEAHRMPHEAE